MEGLYKLSGGENRSGIGEAAGCEIDETSIRVVGEVLGGILEVGGSYGFLDLGGDSRWMREHVRISPIFHSRFISNKQNLRT